MGISGGAILAIESLVTYQLSSIPVHTVPEPCHGLFQPSRKVCQ